MRSVFQDFGLALRTLFKAPGFSAVVIVTLALGIGANTAIFSVVSSVLLRPLPYTDPERMVMVRATWTGVQRGPLAPGDVGDLIEHADLFEGFAGIWMDNTDLKTGDSPPEQVRVGLVTPNFFTLLGLEPQQGRVFEEDDRQVALVSDGLWRRRFGADPDVVGQTIEALGGPMTVIGVLPPALEVYMPSMRGTASAGTAMWAPLHVNLNDPDRENQWLRVFARLKPGVEVEQAQAQLDDISAQIREDFATYGNSDYALQARPLLGEIVGQVRPTLIAVLAAVGFVLLIACANVANLFLIRNRSREKEIAVRAALGGSRRRIVQLLVTESLTFAVLGAGLGLLLADAGIDLLMLLKPANLPRLEAVGIDSGVLLFTAAATLLTTFLVGLLPAARLFGANLIDPLRERSSAGTGPRLLTGRLLVVAEVALSLVLLVGAGLVVRSFVALRAVDPGFDSRNALTFRLRLPPAEVAEIERELAVVPGVERVGSTNKLPLSGSEGSGPYAPERLASQDRSGWPEADIRFISAGFVEAAGLRLLRGETLRPDQDRGRVMIDRTLAERQWPGQDPVGRRIRYWYPIMDQPAWGEVAGVVENVHHRSMRESGRETVYVQRTASTRENNWVVVVRTRSDPNEMIETVRGALFSINPDATMGAVRIFSSYVDDALAPTRFALVLMTVFAIIAVTMAAVGLYGVLSYAVTRRRREMGVRMALGAEPNQIRRLVLAEGTLLAVVGIGFGLAGSLAVTRLLGSVLFGVHPADPITYGLLAMLLAAVTGLAQWLPARRATRVDPIRALRAE